MKHLAHRSVSLVLDLRVVLLFSFALCLIVEQFLHRLRHPNVLDLRVLQLTPSGFPVGTSSAFLARLATTSYHAVFLTTESQRQTTTRLSALRLIISIVDQRCLRSCLSRSDGFCEFNVKEPHLTRHKYCRVRTMICFLTLLVSNEDS